MNSCSFIGRITKDHSIKAIDTKKGRMSVLEFTLAVNDRKGPNGESHADFINCKAFGSLADVIFKYTKKGSLLGLVGSLKTSNFTNKDNERVYKWEVVVEKITFCHGYSNNDNNGNQSNQLDANIEITSDELPF